MITGAKNYNKINIIFSSKSVTDSKPQVYSCSQSPPSQFWVDLLSIQVFHRCRFRQVDCGDLIHCSWGCTVNFPFLFFVHTAPGFQLGFGPTSACSLPSAFCSCPGRMGLKQQLIKGLWVTHALGRDMYSNYNWDAGQAYCGGGWRDVATVWVTAFVFQGKLYLDHGTLLWWAAQAPEGWECG